MEHRDPPDDTRRAIEGLLGKPRRPEDGPKGEGEIIDVEPDDSYQPTGIGMTSADPEPAPRKTVRRGNRTVIVVASLVIIFAVAVVFALLYARDWMGALLPQQGGSNSEIAALRDEITRLKTAVASGSDIEMKNLRDANSALERSLAESKQRIEALQGEIDGLKGGGESSDVAGRLAAAEAEVKQLQDTLEVSRAEVARLTQDHEDSSQRMISYSRENSRIYREMEALRDENTKLAPLRAENVKLGSEIESLKRDISSVRSQLQVAQATAQQGTDSSAQLDKVNDEYRRVLTLLKESRDAEQEKQGRIDSLNGEAATLRQQVRTLESKVRQLTAAQPQTTTSTAAAETPPRTVQVVKPEYPPSARSRGISGIVQVKVLVGEDGSVLEAEVVSSPDPLRALDRAALAAVRKWRFQPATRNGRVIRAWHTVPLEFTLRKDE